MSLRIHHCLGPVLWVCFMLGLLLLPAPVRAQDAGPRQEIPLRDSWKFKAGDNAAWSAKDENDSTWEPVTLPHDWNIVGKVSRNAPTGGSGGFVEAGTAWYRRTFTLPENVAGRRVFIEFDGAFMNTSVWINGFQLGTHPYGYTPFSYDLTPHLKAGEPNLLAVRVDNSLQPASRWYTGSGIYRPVRLVVTSQVHFDRNGIFATFPEVGPARATVRVESQIRLMAFPDSEKNWSKAAEKRLTKTLLVRSTLLSPAGEKVATQETDLAAQDYSYASLTQDLAVPNPRLWSAETPELYTLQSELLFEGQVIDAVRTPLGIRSLAYTESGLHVNGRPVQLKGVCLHQDLGPLGVAFYPGAWELRLRQLKAMGCNAVRLSHHPFATEFLDLCDRLGLYVMDESFDEWQAGHDLGFTEDAWGKQGVQYGYHRLFADGWRRDVKAMVLQARNHPSVVLYSIGNEIPDQRTLDGVETLKELQDFVHGLDATRPVTMGNDWHASAEANGFFDAIDIAGYNYVNRVEPKNQYAAILKRHPKRRLVGTETYYDVKGWVNIRDNPAVIGEFLWVGYDYLGESPGWPLRGWNKGMIDIGSFEKPIFYHRQAMWSAEPMVFIAVDTGEKPGDAWTPPRRRSHWNWADAKAPLKIEVYSNAENVELLLNGRSLGVQPVNPDEYLARFEVPFAPGVLEAIAHRDGKIVARSQVRTAGEAKSLAVEVAKPQFAYAAPDVVNLRVAIMDANGTVLPEAKDMVSFSVEGEARLLATASGDLTDHEPYPFATRRAFQGRCLAVLKPTGAPGAITVTVSAAGLTPAAIKIAK